MDENNVSKDMHEGRCKIEDERFGRDKERLDGMEGNLDKVTTLTVQMGEILKQNNEKIENHDQRLTAIECKPTKMIDAVKSAVVVSIAVSLVGAVLALIFK